MNTPSPRIPNRFRMASVIFLALILVGTSGYRWLEEMNTVDALYDRHHQQHGWVS